MEQLKLTDSEKLDYINKKIKRIQISTDIQTAIIILAFIGIVNFSELKKKINGKI